MTTHIACV